MLEVNLDKLKQFTKSYQNEPLRWLNIIHSSDIVAYPIRSSLDLTSTENLVFQDKFVSTDANLAEKATRTVGQLDAALVLGVADAHVGYWQCQQTARLVTANIFGEVLQDVINRLDKVPGMAKDLMQLSRHSPIDKTLEDLKLRDSSGTLRLIVNAVQVHHVYVFDNKDNCKFGGYVSWMHTNNLKQEIDFIKSNFC